MTDHTSAGSEEPVAGIPSVFVFKFFVQCDGGEVVEMMMKSSRDAMRRSYERDETESARKVIKSELLSIVQPHQEY